jgi:hypothetical protein
VASCGGQTAARDEFPADRFTPWSAGFQSDGTLRAETLREGQKEKPAEESRMQDIELLLNFSKQMRDS